MKMMQVVNALPALQKLAAQEFTLQKLYNIKKLMGKLDEELTFYNEQRSKIYEKYSDIVGNQYVPREGEVSKLNEELSELLNMDIEGVTNEVVLGVNEDIKLSYNDLVALEGFVRIEE